MKLFPAIDVESTSELILAIIDEFAPTAVEPRGASTRIFFPSTEARDAAGASLRDAGYRVQPVEVSDEDWARRSQENLGRVSVGRITVVAPWHDLTPRPDEIVLVIVPSMGFGTGHHETTRLCLRALQEIDVAGASVLDVGTGSGVLAIAADRLGAANVLGIDSDPDALESARENLALNPGATRTTFEQHDVTSVQLSPTDVVTANLTSALLVRIADRLTETVRTGGWLILSGILAEERDAVRDAFAGLASMREQQESEWVGLVLKKP